MRGGRKEKGERRRVRTAGAERPGLKTKASDERRGPLDARNGRRKWV
jgi:hypothetical protein